MRGLVAGIAALIGVVAADVHDGRQGLPVGGPPPDPADGLGQFTPRRAEVHAWVGFDAFPASAPTQGNDVWGYVSPGGREYAFIGLDTIVGLVDVTDPAAPVVTAELVHPTSDWTDTRTYADHAYISNQASGGIQVFDLSQVDAGIVTELAPVTGDGLASAHTIALDAVSGWLYTAGSNIHNGGIVAIDLSDPDVPVVAGSWGDNYIHALQVVTHETGPFAGMEVAYSCAGTVGLQIHDVTDKANITLIGEATYDTQGYTHQGWLDWDRQLYFVNDETDELKGKVPSATTYVFDVSDIFAPELVSMFTNGLPSIDHNLMLRDGIVYEANYLSGLRIWDARVDPFTPTEVGWVDTYPSVDEIAFAGAWGVYAALPSGTILVSDIESGLFVIGVDEALDAPPDAFDLTSPADGSIVVQTEDVLAWETSVAADEYTLTVATDSGFTAGVAEFTVDGTATGQPIEELGLPSCETWWWRLTAHGFNGDTANISDRSFVVGPLGDLDGDADVDNADLKRLKKAFVRQAAFGDLNGDGAVDKLDRDLLVQNAGICP